MKVYHLSAPSIKSVTMQDICLSHVSTFIVSFTIVWEHAVNYKLNDFPLSTLKHLLGTFRLKIVIDPTPILDNDGSYVHVRTRTVLGAV